MQLMLDTIITKKPYKPNSCKVFFIIFTCLYNITQQTSGINHFYLVIITIDRK
jgi:hypothetical protein